MKVLDRLCPAEGERILDIGCGSGRLTRALHERVPSAAVVAMDRSAAMVLQAHETLGGRVPVVQADGLYLPWASCFDAVFSTATFHWIADHDRLFAEVHRALVPGGRLVAQAGGGANLARLYQRTSTLGQTEFRHRFAGWRDPYYFAGVPETEDRLRSAGFTNVRVWLESTPTPFADPASYRAFVATVCLRHQLARLERGERDTYLDRIVGLAAGDDPPFTLDYWRLNIDARRP